MAKGPAVVIVARHGARLDAADKTWHLTSPTPYDPPLTYGGWAQSRALGLRIAALLQARELAAGNGVETNGGNNDLEHLDFSPLDQAKHTKASAKSTKRKQKIVIHSSPYLRCVQTSICISAGIAQFQPASDHPTKLGNPHLLKERQGLHGRSGPPLSRTTAPVTSLAADGMDDAHLEVFRKSLKTAGPEKITLRIDAFLGEWLSPDYFDNITPPPNSTMMVAGAKADLLRRGEYIEAQQNPHSIKGHFPGGWMKNSSSTAGARPISQTEDGPLSNLGSLAQVSPFRERASSHGSVASSSSRTSHKATSLAKPHKLPNHIYEPPVPTWSVSPSDPIPRGYVTHARDACTDVDYQWDSMRPPLEWGDGGEYGDEWSTMHKRFRRGLAGLMMWYRNNKPSDPQEKTPDSATDKVDEGDDDEELILVLVTHGAGCNALLGAITNQPVLLDVGMASLSMAVKKEGPPERTPSPAASEVRRSSVMDIGLSEEYEMKMLASLDHLRKGVDPAKPPQPSSPAVAASPSLDYRRRFGSQSGGVNSPIDSPLSLGEPMRNVNSSLGSMRRSSVAGVSSKMFSPTTPSGALSPTMGLWGSKTTNNGSDLSASPGRDMVLNFSDSRPKSVTTATSPDLAESSETDDVAPLPTSLARSSSIGLWGPPPSVAQRLHERGPKRRWTVSERDA